MLRRYAALLAGAALLPGCASASAALSQAAPVACAADDTSDYCLLQDTRAALSQIEGLSDWITVGSEYAKALHAAGREQEANRFLQSSWQASSALPDPAERGEARIALAKTWVEVGGKQEVLRTAEAILEDSLAVENAAKRQDMQAAAIVLIAKSGELEEALVQMLALPRDDETLASFKARGLREIAAYAAKTGKFDIATQVLAQIDMGLLYYRNVARSDVAEHAMAAGRTDLAQRLLDEAINAARRDPDGYFAAGALRDAAAVLARHGETARVEGLFLEALITTDTAKSKQEQARAVSRVVTAMADAGMTNSAQELLEEALSIGDEDERELFRDFARYEIAGSAAFSGRFALADAITAQAPERAFGSATSLRSVMQRDLAWGYMRAGDAAMAAATARSISTARERTQALARLVLLRADPSMEAPARYL